MTLPSPPCRASTAGLRIRDPECPFALHLAEGVLAAAVPVARIGFDPRIAAGEVSVGKGALQRYLAAELGFWRRPFDGRAVGHCIQRLQREGCVLLQLLRRQ